MPGASSSAVPLDLAAVAAFCDAHGIGSGPVRARAARRRPLQPDLPRRARRTAVRAAAATAAAPAAVGARHAAREHDRRRPAPRRSPGARGARGLRRPGRARRAVLPDDARRRCPARHRPAGRGRQPRRARPPGTRRRRCPGRAARDRPPRRRARVDRPAATAISPARCGGSLASGRSTARATCRWSPRSARSSPTPCPTRAPRRSSTATTGSATCWSPPTRRAGSRAILDWELATIGDPLADLGYLVSAYVDRDSPPGEGIVALSPVTRAGRVSHPGRARGALRGTQRPAGRAPRLVRGARPLEGRDLLREHVPALPGRRAHRRLRPADGDRRAGEARVGGRRSPPVPKSARSRIGPRMPPPASHSPLTPLSALLHAASVWGERPAVRWDDWRITYRELLERVARVAGGARRRAASSRATASPPCFPTCPSCSSCTSPRRRPEPCSCRSTSASRAPSWPTSWSTAAPGCW